MSSLKKLNSLEECNGQNLCMKIVVKKSVGDERNKIIYFGIYSSHGCFFNCRRKLRNSLIRLAFKSGKLLTKNRVNGDYTINCYCC